MTAEREDCFLGDREKGESGIDVWQEEGPLNSIFGMVTEEGRKDVLRQRLLEFSAWTKVEGHLRPWLEVNWEIWKGGVEGKYTFSKKDAMSRDELWLDFPRRCRVQAVFQRNFRDESGPKLLKTLEIFPPTIVKNNERMNSRLGCGAGAYLVLNWYLEVAQIYYSREPGTGWLSVTEAGGKQFTATEGTFEYLEPLPWNFEEALWTVKKEDRGNYLLFTVSKEAPFPAAEMHAEDLSPELRRWFWFMPETSFAIPKVSVQREFTQEGIRELIGEIWELNQAAARQTSP